MFMHNTHNNIIFIHIHEIYPHLIPQFDIWDSHWILKTVQYMAINFT